ncbi:MAG: type III-B CRISPR-associated protein Cas10/Cmr2 [Bacteroidetes bacterium 4572_77]|nr:MAG: type III-B CRISPR-associated protein Cas10/Cmr2 [Bacteroidetes bacterium 4572_77]
MITKYLFLFTISPVQAFIAQARKAQDLFAGSQLLTDLTRYAIGEFNNDTNNKGEIIFPAKWEKEHDAALPNRFMAEIECDPKDILLIGEKLEQKVKAYFKQLAEQVFLKRAKGQRKPLGFDSQIENHLIIHWVFEEFKNRSYLETFNAIESNLGSIKNIREFKQLADTEIGRKDNLSGELNALFFNNKSGKPAFTKDAIQINAPSSLLSPGEGLSAVSLTKRFYNYELTNPFPSTAEIAQMDIKEDIESSGSFKLFRGIVQKDFDYQLLYKDNLNIKYFDKQGIDFPANNESLLEFHKGIFKEIKATGKKQKKYYAILIFDGDDMGKWLSGKALGEKQNDDAYLKKYHFRFSELLADFAKSVKAYVDNNNYGRTIFAGGDDFMAMLNLDKLFDVVVKLRSKFTKEVSEKLKSEYPETVDNVNFSAGIAIAHYQHPLSDVLNTAREMEKKAKGVDGKNALSIAVLKKSGEQQKMVIKWGEDQTNIQSIINVINALKQKNFSPAFIENLNQVFQVFVGSEKPEELLDVFRLEAGTFIKRAKMPNVNAVIVEGLKKDIENLYDVLDLRNTLEALNIIDFIYRKA